MTAPLDLTMRPGDTCIHYLEPTRVMVVCSVHAQSGTALCSWFEDVRGRQEVSLPLRDLRPTTTKRANGGQLLWSVKQ